LSSFFGIFQIVSERPLIFLLTHGDLVHAKRGGLPSARSKSSNEPHADHAALSALLICKPARGHGITVLLSGAGGDDIFTGSDGMKQRGRTGKWVFKPNVFIASIASIAVAPRKWRDFSRGQVSEEYAGDLSTR